ncbi:MAG TPA: hypothetical protein DCE42_04465 [Myxococcales bacterium]|nr:hypothetical protein [Deltaproteobacteria bacterium]MBU51670.1 hypothetical protein [Deltaproteobacteria bacterium]HAA53981.1 hypothetical protein [Myxococcales bacterium]
MTHRILFIFALLSLTTLLAQCSKPKQCNSLCELHTTRCDGDQLGISTCSYSSSTQCLTWTFSPCETGKTCKEINGQATCTGCEKYASRGCVDADIYWLDSCGKPHEKLLTCPENTQCKEDRCVAKSGGCSESCVENEQRCTNDGWQIICERNPNTSCLQWSSPTECPSGQYCENKLCEVIKCTTPCSPGRTRCQGLKIQTCAKQPNGCTYWASAQSCRPGQICTNDICVQNSCPSTCVKEADCQVQECGLRTACIQNACTVPNTQCPSSCQQDAACNVQSCGEKKACIRETCQVLPTTCPQSCIDNSQCRKEVCGNKTTCVNNQCEVSTNQCPTTCKDSTECDIPVCGRKTECLLGICQSPQQSCPSSCKVDADCQLAACGHRQLCINFSCQASSKSEQSTAPDGGGETFRE